MSGAEPPHELARPKWRPLEPRVERALRIGIPPGLYAAALLGGFLTLPFDRFVQFASLMNGYLVLPLGREITIPLMLSAGFSVPQSVGLVVFVDFVAACFVAWNLDLARRLPYIGAFIRGAESVGRHFRERHPSLRALGLFGLFLWAVKPGRGSGGATSAVLGKIVFVETRWLVPTIVAASLVGCTLVALAAEALVRGTGISLTLAGGALLLAVAIYYLYMIRRELAGKISQALHREKENAGEE